jgi:hypothetical protein
VQTYREDLVGALCTLSAVASDAERCRRRLQGNVAAFPHNILIDRARKPRAITAFDITSRVLLSASRHIRAYHMSVPASRRRARAHSTTANIMHRVRGVPMEFIERADDRPEQISIARGRELLGDEAESMTDQDVVEIRRHAETMAWIVVEMYLEHARIPE